MNMKTFVGLIMGSVLIFFFLKFDIKPPEVFQLTGKLKALPEQFIALYFLEDAESNLKKQQHAVATLIKYDANYYVEIDSLIDYELS